MEIGKISLVIVMLTIKDSSNFNKRNVDYDGIFNVKSKISLVIVMLSTKDPSKTPQQRKRKLRGNTEKM